MLSGRFYYIIMKLNVNDIFLLVQKLTRKNQSGSISSQDFFYMWNAEQNMYFNDLIGRWQARGNGKSGANTGLMLNETSITELSPFIIPVNLTISSGAADKPTDYEYFIALRVAQIYKCQLIRPDQIPAVSTSVIDPPSIPNNKYYAIEYEDYYSFLPNTMTAAQLDYIASPENINWGFTFDIDGRQVYNPGSSVQPKWSNSTIITITKRSLTNWGVSWHDKDFENFGRVAQQTGD